MQYPVIDLIAQAYLNNGWTGLDIPQTITYEPIQLGSGEPSPDNVRPILPAAILNIGGVDIPVYCGSLNIQTKELIITHTITIISNITDWNFYSVSGGNIQRCNIDVIKQAGKRDDWKCSHFHAPVDTYRNPLSEGCCRNYYFNVYNMEFCLELSTTLNEWRIYLSEQNNRNTPITLYHQTENNIVYTLTNEELIEVIGLKDNIAHRLKLPLPHYFPHPVIDALQRAAAGTQTAEDNEILKHYLTPLGIGGI